MNYSPNFHHFLSVLKLEREAHARRLRMWVYYSLGRGSAQELFWEKFKNMWKWKAKAHCFQHSFLHTFSFSMLILSFIDFHDFWSSGSMSNHVLGGLEPSETSRTSLGMTLETFLKLQFFEILTYIFDEFWRISNDEFDELKCIESDETCVKSHKNI